MSKEKETLTASKLKAALWDTLNDVREGKMQPAVGDSIATAAREILRTVKVQLRVSAQSNRDVPADVITFSEK